MPDALQGVAVVLAENGKSAEAVELTQEISDANFRSAALSQIVEVIARSGNFDEAEALARRIEVPESRAIALLSVAHAFQALQR